MRTAGIIAEYNPFHNGHLYQIEEVRKQTGSDYVVVVMSGDFVQRGEPAIFDKYTRTHMALAAGADLVFELPVPFATASAELFAQGAVSLFDQTGIIDLLCFGSESGSLDDLKRLADVLATEPETYVQSLKKFLKEGNSFPLARELALRASLGAECSLSSPNDILGVEYLKALIRTGSTIEPFTIRREGQHYNDATNPESLGSFPSASALRALICENSKRRSPEELFKKLSPWIPASALEALRQEQALLTPVFVDDFSLLLNSRILELSKNQVPFEQFADLSPELASRLGASILNFDSFSGRIAALKSRQLTYTRISRALLHLLLGIESEAKSPVEAADVSTAQLPYEERGKQRKKSERLPYARILGFRKSASPLLSKLKANSSIPILTKIAGAEAKLSEDGVQMLREELFASHLYQSVVFQKGRRMKNEYTRSIVLLP
ncbi:tRNA(Met) cytidine acetate ligase [Brotaphodocola sp.]|uniref:tRNA(Met) cytidine acetate ligase n=1 Tax=Brotaphodocola sp. TaxID=3073577 RepID=UPI003D7E671D